MQVNSACGEQKKRTTISEPFGSCLTMISLKLACKLATCETIRSYTSPVNSNSILASQVANRNICSCPQRLNHHQPMATCPTPTLTLTFSFLCSIDWDSCTPTLTPSWVYRRSAMLRPPGF